MSEHLITLSAGFLGLLFGSFANVVIARLPEGESVVLPASHCLQCNTPLKWYHNIPVFSYIALRGKCAFCSKTFSVRYPLVEILMAVCFALTAFLLGPSWFLIEALILVFGLVTITFIDLDHMIIPNVFTFPGMIIGLAGALVNPERSFWEAFAGLMIGGGFFYLIAVIYAFLRKREGLGGGDIKLLAWIGAVLGWQSIPYTILVSSVLGSVVGISISIFNRKKNLMELELPFGPYISLAALFYLWTKDTVLISWYQSYMAVFGF